MGRVAQVRSLRRQVVFYDVKVSDHAHDRWQQRVLPWYESKPKKLRQGLPNDLKSAFNDSIYVGRYEVGRRMYFYVYQWKEWIFLVKYHRDKDARVDAYLGDIISVWPARWLKTLMQKQEQWYRIG